MGNEVEVKWILNSLDEKVKTLLGYFEITNLSLINQNHFNIIQRLNSHLHKISYSANILAIDQFYWPTENIDLTKIGKLRYGNNGIYVNNEKVLRLNLNKNTESEVLDLIELINLFNSKPEFEPFKRQLRIRNEIIDLKLSTYLTGKSKNGIGDENNLECEVEIAPHQNLDLFFNSIGYYLKDDRKKTKRKNKISGYITYENQEIKTNVEFITINELPGLEFLEIEALPEFKCDTKGLVAKIHEIALSLGVENNRIENRGYQVLQNILSEVKN